MIKKNLKKHETSAYVYMHETYVHVCMRHMHMYETIYVYIYMYIHFSPIIRHLMLKDAVSASASAS